MKHSECVRLNCKCLACGTADCDGTGCLECEIPVGECDKYTPAASPNPTEKFGNIISSLDTAAGMLIVASVRDPTVRRSKELVLQASFDLGNLIDELE